MIGDSQKGGLQDLLRNRLRIFLRIKKINIKLLNEEKIKELKKIKLKKKKEQEIRRYFLYEENKFKKVTGYKIPVLYACSVDYYEISQGYASNVICANDGEILAHTIYDSIGNPSLQCSSKDKFNKLINNSNINLKNYSKIIVNEKNKIATIKPNEILKNDHFDINEVVFQDNVIVNRPIDVISENEFNKSIIKTDQKEHDILDKVTLPKVIAGISLYSTVKLADNLLNKNQNINVLNSENQYTDKEQEILNIVNKFIDDSKDEIDKMRLELDDINKRVEDEYDQEKLEELQKRYLELKEKVEKLKHQFEIIKNNTDFMNFNELDDSILWDKIDDYKFFEDNESISILARDCQKEIEKMEKIIVLYEDSNLLEKDIEEKQEDFEKRDNKYEKDDNKLKEIEMIDEKVRYNLAKQEEYLKKLSKDVEKIDFKTKKIYKLKGFDKLLSNVAKMTVGLITLPFSGRHGSIVLGSLLVNNAIKGLKNSLKYEEENKTYVRYTDFAYKIKNEQEKLEFSDKLITNSIEEIQEIKKDYHNLFEEYKYKIPEYSEMIKRIEAVEENLVKKQKQIEDYTDSFKKKAEKNKVKMKKINSYRDQY